MKIIVMDSANVRIEVLNVPDHMIEEDIEQFLAEHDYSLNNISWMAAPIDFVPVQFHEYGICHSDGEELHFVRQGKLKDFSIYDSVQEVKHREQEELAEKLRLRGKKVDDGYEWHFEGECPIVAAYDYDEHVMWLSFLSEWTRTDISPSLAMRRMTEVTSMRLMLTKSLQVIWTSSFPK